MGVTGGVKGVTGGALAGSAFEGAGFGSDAGFAGGRCGCVSAMAF